MKKKTLVVEEGCDTWLSTRNKTPAVAVTRKARGIKSVRRNGCQVARVMSSLQFTPTPVRTTRQTSIAGYLVKPQEAKGNPDEEESVPPPTKTSHPQCQRRRLSDDKENIQEEKNNGIARVDGYGDVTRLLDDCVFLSPCLRRLSTLDYTSQGANRSECTPTTSLIGNDEIVSRSQITCYGTRALEGVGFCSVPPGDFYTEDESQFTIRSPGRGRFCIARGRNQTLAPVVHDNSVDVLTDSCFTLDCTNTNTNNFTVSTDSPIICESSLRIQTGTSECDDTGSDFTELAYTFHSDGEVEKIRQSPSFRSPKKSRATFSDALTRPRISGDDDSNFGGATCDSSDFRFTFHTESSQVHFENDMRRKGRDDFRFSDCDSVSSTMD